MKKVIEIVIGEKEKKEDLLGYLIDYVPPEGYFGYGLNVWDQYDNKYNTLVGIF